jgi:PAS domain-containing protein
VFGNRVLRRIFGLMRDEVTGRERIKLHNEELRDLYTSSNILRNIKRKRMRWMGHVARMGMERNGNNLLVRK